jgi:gluconolactonase
MASASPLQSPGAADATAFVSHDAGFSAVLGDSARLSLVVETDAHEGPVYVLEEDALYFTTLPSPGELPGDPSPVVNVKRIALDGERFPLDPERVSIVRGDANVANGMTLDRDGRLVACEQGTRSQRAAVTALDRANGELRTLADEWRGLPLNSPNDVVVRSDGSIWFTDPSYGHLQGFRPEPALGDYVYRLDPRSGRLCIVADSFDKPNGLAFSPDETVLYVGDSGANHEPGSFDPARPHHIKAFDVVAGRRLTNERLLCVTNPGFPDGIKVDADGRVYASAFSGVQVFDPEGELIGEIAVPGAVNFTFGGPDRNVLFITGDEAVWAAELNVTSPPTAGRAVARPRALRGV